MTNPFDAPLGNGPGATGHLDVMKAINVGWEATQRNALPWLGVLIAGGVAMTISLLLCVLPYFIVGPAVLWGMTRFHLDAIDGEAKFEVLFSGFERLGDIVPPILFAGLIMFAGIIALEIPLFIVQGVLAMLDSDVLTLVVGLPVNLVFMVAIYYIMARLLFWQFLIVDRGLGAMDALTESWRITSGKVLPIVGLVLACSLLIFVGALLCLLPAIPATMVFYGATASAYRQLTGDLRA